MKRPWRSTTPDLPRSNHATRKELIAGYAIIDVGSLDEAIELARRFLTVASDGESEVRQMYDAPAYESDPIAGPEYPLAS